MDANDRAKLGQRQLEMSAMKARPRTITNWRREERRQPDLQPTYSRTVNIFGISQGIPSRPQSQNAFRGVAFGGKQYKPIGKLARGHAERAYNDPHGNSMGNLVPPLTLAASAASLLYKEKALPNLDNIIDYHNLQKGQLTQLKPIELRPESAPDLPGEDASGVQQSARIISGQVTERNVEADERESDKDQLESEEPAPLSSPRRAPFNSLPS